VGWDELKQRRDWDEENVKMARRSRSETAMTLDWIAQPLVMGIAGYAAQCLRELKGKKYVILRD